jgi:hypothetical protein
MIDSRLHDVLITDGLPGGKSHRPLSVSTVRDLPAELATRSSDWSAEVPAASAARACPENASVSRKEDCGYERRGGYEPGTSRKENRREYENKNGCRTNMASRWTQGLRFGRNTQDTRFRCCLPISGSGARNCHPGRNRRVSTAMVEGRSLASLPIPLRSLEEAPLGGAFSY